MMRIAVQVEDAEKAELLLELLSSIDFIKKDELALLERRNERFPDDTVLIKFVSEAPDPILRFRSPRFIQE